MDPAATFIETFFISPRNPKIAFQNLKKDATGQFVCSFRGRYICLGGGGRTRYGQDKTNSTPKHRGKGAKESAGDNGDKEESSELRGL